MEDKINYFLNEIKKELEKAMMKYPLFNSYHEGYAVLLEEMDEMWEEIKKKNPFDKLIKEECIQVAAMALKILISFFNKNE